MSTTTTTITLARSRSGLPVVYEEGGGRTSTGNATIWAGPAGERLEALWVPGRPYSNGQAAAFVARPGMLCIQAWWSRRGEGVVVHRIAAIDDAKNEAAIELVWSWQTPDPEEVPPPHLAAAVEAARRKAGTYHARYTAYADEPRRRPASYLPQGG